MCLTFIIKTRARLVTDEMCFYLSFMQRKFRQHQEKGGLNGMDGLRYSIYNISTFYLVRCRVLTRRSLLIFSVHREIREAARTKHVNSIKNLFEMVLTLWQAQCTCFTVLGSKSYELSWNLKSRLSLFTSFFHSQTSQDEIEFQLMKGIYRFSNYFHRSC